MNNDRFHRLRKMCLLSSTTWPCLPLHVGQTELSVQTILSCYPHANGLSPRTGRAVGRRGLPFSIYKVFVPCAFISGIFKVKFWCSVNQEATSILVEMWWFSLYLITSPSCHFPCTVTSLFDRGWSFITQGPSLKCGWNEITLVISL